MRLPGRAAAAIEVLADVDAGRRPVSEALKAWGLAHRFAGAGDRAAIGNLVYDALRRRASHAFAMGSEDPRALILSVLVRDWGEPVERLAAEFAADAHAPAGPDAGEVARLTASDPLADAPEFVRADVPEFLVPSLERSLGADWVASMAAMARRPSLDLRANRLKADPARVVKSLSRFAVREGDLVPDALVLPAGERDARTPNVSADEGYLKGWFEIQDQGSQAVALLADAAPGSQVLDFCAGAGGKSLALAAAMGNKGQIFAHDADRQRLAPIYDRLKRAGARNVQVRAPNPGALDDLVGKMDLVLVDAPCTGTGTWRRRPDTKWKLTPALLAGRVAEQAAILEDALRYVRPGGHLVYVTCSLLAQENEDQAEALLARHETLRATDLSTVWARRLRGPLRARIGRGLTLTPDRTATDGFFVARFERAR